jgi:nicotinamidase/pyrazinamidase
VNRSAVKPGESHEKAGTFGIQPRPGDALIIVDLQNDFLPGGNLAVSGGDEVIPVLNGYIAKFLERGLPIFATRDWHPPNHCSFRDHGGRWPAHCVRDSEGAAFSKALNLPISAVIISKATLREQDAYSGFEKTELSERLKAGRIRRLFIGGLATDYCVLHTVLDARKLGFKVFLLCDAIRAVNVNPDDGAKAESEMVSKGAVPIHLRDLSR